MVLNRGQGHFRAVRHKLEPHDFALSEGQDIAPTHLVDETTSSGIKDLPDDVAIRISDLLSSDSESNPCHTPAAGLLWLNCPADALETHVESLAFHLPAVDLRAFGFSVIEFVKPKRIIIKTPNERNAITTAAMINEPRSAMKHCKASIFSGL